MKKPQFLKLAVLAVPCTALAFALLMQALSSIATRNSPEQAAMFFSANGLAQEQRAFRLFQAGVGAGDGLGEAARKAAPIAKQGLAIDPLAPKSYALLAMAAENSDERKAILQYANQVNRRDLSLQGMVLEEHLAANDYRNAIETLDQLLRVHPDFYDDFFPVLLKALQNPEAAPLFPDILNAREDWHDRFLLFAVGDEDARKNLAIIREDLDFDNTFFDSQLINGLAQQGEMVTALSLYRDQRPQSAGKENEAGGPWVADFPPFDWSLAAERDFRSQPSPDGTMLELYARSGQGGIIARRTIGTPDIPFAVKTTLEMRARGRAEAVRLILRCTGFESAIFDQPLDAGDNVITVDKLPDNCQQVKFEILARALRGEPTLRAEMSAIRVTQP